MQTYVKVAYNPLIIVVIIYGVGRKILTKLPSLAVVKNSVKKSWIVISIITRILPVARATHPEKNLSKFVDNLLSYSVDR